jgi:hypothetical protein
MIHIDDRLLFFISETWASPTSGHSTFGAAMAAESSNCFSGVSGWNRRGREFRRHKSCDLRNLCPIESIMDSAQAYLAAAVVFSLSFPATKAPVAAFSMR